MYKDKVVSAIAVRKTQHRTVAWLKAMNMNNAEIARETGLSYNIINSLTSSKSFMGEVDKIKSEIGKNPDRLFNKILPKAIKTAYSIMTDKNSKDSVRLNAAFNFMDRSLGKPKQQVEVESSVLADIIEKLDQNKDNADPRFDVVEVDSEDIEINKNIEENIK